MTNQGKAPRFTIVRLEERIAPGAMGGFCGGNGSGKGSKKSGKGSKKSNKGSKKSKKGSHKKGSNKCHRPPVCPPRPCW